MNINFKKLTKKAKIPAYANNDTTNAGLDLSAVSINETESYIEYGTGIAIEIPTGYVGLLFPRSSNSKYDLCLANCVGIIDSNYRGEIKLRFKKIVNMSKMKIVLDKFYNLFGLKNADINVSDSYKTYKVGDMIGQLIILPYPIINMVQVDELSSTERGDNGFGSTTPEQCNTQN